MITIKEAQKLILTGVTHSNPEEINLADGLGKIAANNVYTDRDYPPFNRSAVDGYGIIAGDYLDKGIQKYTLVGELMAGAEFIKPINSGECIKIMTGASVPTFINAVVKVEDCLAEGDTIQIRTQGIKPFLNIALKGEDCKANQLIIDKGTQITPLHLSLLAAVGKSSIKIYKPLSIAVISTGDELQIPGAPVKDYQIRDSNSYSLQGFLNFYKIPLAYRAISKDDPEALTRTFEEASFCDIVIFTGGVSMGDADYVPSILKAVGVKEIFHKVKIRPGKPIWFGRKGTQAIFGLPGNPLSVMVGFKIFIEPYLRKAMGMQSQPAFKFPLDNKKIKKVNLDEFFLCKLKTDGQSKLETIKSNGSGDFTSVLLSDGIALHPVEAKDIEEDDLVDFIFWRSIR